MPDSAKSVDSRARLRLVWGITLFLVAIGLAAAARRMYLLAYPPHPGRNFPAAALDAGFSAHRALTLVHIVPGFLFMALVPFQFVNRIRSRHIAWHRWSGRILMILGFIIGSSALVMSYTMAIGGASETAATTFFAILFLLFLSLGFWNIRQGNIAHHREWMIRAFGVALGVATTRPIVGAFFATGRLSPHEFFGAAFWLGFTTTLLAAEAWIHHAEPRRHEREMQLPFIQSEETREAR
jgi:Predicted membrane protein (DUF2306)